MTKKIFISHKYEDRAYRDQIKDWANNGLLGDVEIVTETQDMRQGGASAVRGHLRPILRTADAAVVLVGQDSHNRPWVDEEVHNVSSAGKPVVAVQLPNTTGAAPREVRNQGAEVSKYSPTELKRAIDSALKKP